MVEEVRAPKEIPSDVVDHIIILTVFLGIGICVSVCCEALEFVFYVFLCVVKL